MMGDDDGRQLTGQTRDVGFQIGARKTFEIELHAAWELLTSGRGLQLWLGEAEGLELKPGARYRTSEGAEGEVRVFKPRSHVRLTWRPPGWERASTVQVRVIPSGHKTVISFHQEHLRGPDEREQMRERWHAALARLDELIAARG